MNAFLIRSLLLVLSFAGVAANAQYLSLSYPKYNSVMQRNANNQATITIAGQLVFGTGADGAIAPGTILSYRIKTLSANPNVQGATINLSMAANGMFYTSTVLSKGWYLVEVMLNGVVYAASKVGVGDVFFVAGQSNAQGFGNNLNPMDIWMLPKTSGFPEWIVGMNSDYNCTKNLPETYDNMYSLTDAASHYNRLGPTGNNVWCYGVLGKKISDANGGMPVAFFNAASGGSSVTQWYQGAQGLAAPNPFTGGAQFCLGHNNGSVNPVDYYGQPYTPLRSGLNYYASLYGIRAVLWHQGETDSNINIAPAYKAASAQDYQNKLQFVINKSRADFGATVNPNILTWIVAKATISEFGPLNNTIRAGQGNVVGSGAGNAGPDSDYVTESAGTTTVAGYRRDLTHFEESKNNALSWLAGKWFDAIGNLGNKISAGFVPQLTYSSNGNKRTLTAPAGYAEYRWGSSINNPIAGANGNVFTTESCWPDVKCFIRDSKGNWHVSAATWVHCYASNRIAAEEKGADEADLIPEFKTYPNPYQKEITIEFYVRDDNSHVKLEIVDLSGRVIKTIVDNPHAKGKWTYQSGEINSVTGKMLFCRLKVNDTYMLKRILKAGNETK
ncbi:sialate O-acetylesterase [Dyadobacter sp. CY343]|uniref:sialate O-acetylesterase n=1 Tax=Dyadobacter sp. CY343 TaxID=2907299 RepID=UPI001F206D22|nr:sialate O-acetylesterase [Dyadobacter sp. CY343]MCE7058707.1 hypothetical protein [Dyadobacter sp. CY343]